MKYDVVFVGNKVSAPDLKSLEIPMDNLISCKGEIGSFFLELKEGQDLETAAIIVNLPAEKELPVANVQDFNQDFNLEQDLILIQDYQRLSSADVTDQGLKIALAYLQQANEGTVIYFHRSIRFNGENDGLFEKARRAGVVFIRYQVGELQLDPQQSRVQLNREDLQVNLQGQLQLASPQILPPIPASLKEILRLRTHPQGYLQPENVYLQPTKSSRRGIYILGISRGFNGNTNFEFETEYTLNEIRAQRLNLAKEAEDERIVDDKKCILCYTCYRICPHGAIEEEKELDAMQILKYACQGCNSCLAYCPAAAISLSETKEKPPKEKSKLMLVCENSAALALARENVELPPNIEIQEVPCSCSVKKEAVFADFLQGYQQILLLGCFSEACRHLEGDRRGERMMKQVSAVLEDLELQNYGGKFLRLSPRMTQDIKVIAALWEEGAL